MVTVLQSHREVGRTNGVRPILQLYACWSHPQLCVLLPMRTFTVLTSYNNQDDRYELALSQLDSFRRLD